MTVLWSRNSAVFFSPSTPSVVFVHALTGKTHTHTHTHTDNIKSKIRDVLSYLA